MIVWEYVGMSFLSVNVEVCRWVKVRACRCDCVCVDMITWVDV